MTQSRRADSPVYKVVNPDALQIAIEAADAQNMNLQTPFGPGQAIEPYDGVRGLPRVTDFEPGYNLISRNDRDGRMSFEALRVMCDTYDIANLCIEHRINDVRSLDWTIKAADFATGDVTEQIQQAHQIMAKPDGHTMFRSWLAMYIRDILRYDAGTIYKQRNMVGDAIGLEVVDGTTMSPKRGGRGEVPKPPAYAFVQFIRGISWEWYTTDDIIYQPLNPRSDSMFGLAPIETALLNANTDLRFQNHWLNWFTEGNIPEGFASAPPEITTPEQLERWEAYWAAMNTDERIKHKLKMVPHETTFTFPAEKNFDPNFPLFLMRKTCAAYHVTPNDIGFTDDVNRATGDTQVDVQFRTGTLPLVQHLQDIFTEYLQVDRGLAVVFRFDTGQEKEDRLATAQADAIYMDHAVISPSEVRERVYGLMDDSERPVPRYFGNQRSGPIPLAKLYSIAGAIDPLTAAPSETQPLDTTPYDGTQGIMPYKNPGTPQFTRAPINPDEPERPDLEHPVPGSEIVNPQPPAAPGQVQMRKALFPVTDDARSELVKWRRATLTRLGRGQRPRRFDSAVIPGFISDTVWSHLEKARTKPEVDRIFEAVQKATTPLPVNPEPVNPATGLPYSDVEDPFAYQAGYEDIPYGADTDQFGNPLSPDQQYNTTENLNFEDALRQGDPSTGGDESGDEETLSQYERFRERQEERRRAREEESGHPKVDRWRLNPEDATPQMEADLKLVDTWQSKLIDALVDAVPFDQLHDAIEKLREALHQQVSEDAMVMRAEMAIREVSDFTKAEDVYDSLRKDAWRTGAITAQFQIGYPDAATHWAGWKPGDTTISHLDWWEVQRLSGWRGVEGTTLQRLSSILSYGLTKGQTIDEMAAAFDRYLRDPNRAETIVHTETARMLSYSSLREYRKADMTEWDLLISQDACDICIEVAADNPHNVNDLDSMPPEHPRCRCSVAPHLGDSKKADLDAGNPDIKLTENPADMLTMSAAFAQKIVDLTRDTGGSSTNPYTGASPTSGYMVGLMGNDFIMDGLEFAKRGAAEIQAYANNRSDDFSSPDTYLGTWFDTESGKVSFDTSRNVQDLSEAIALGTSNDQKAIWDVANGVEIGTGGTGGDLSKAAKQTSGTSATLNFYRQQRAYQSDPELAAADRAKRDSYFEEDES